MKPFSSLELASFCGQIALILKAGISSLEGLTIMQEDASSPDEKEVLNALLSNMQETGSLYQAMDSLKLSIVILFFWIASPVSGHMISRLEAMTDERLGEISVLEKNNGIRVIMEDRDSKIQDLDEEWKKGGNGR